MKKLKVKNITEGYVVLHGGTPVGIHAGKEHSFMLTEVSPYAECINKLQSAGFISVEEVEVKKPSAKDAETNPEAGKVELSEDAKLRLEQIKLELSKLQEEAKTASKDEKKKIKEKADALKAEAKSLK